jgi:hypothetical protein
MLLFEEEMIRLSKGILSALPYWMSTIEAAEPSKSVMFTNDYFGPAHGCLSGPLAGVLKSNGSCVSRELKEGPWVVEPVMTLLTRAANQSFPTFSDYLENSIHATVHNVLGGDMAVTRNAPWDILFYLHHAGMDYIWDKMQQQHGKDLYSGDGLHGPVSKKDEMFGFKVEEFLNIQDACYEYVEPGKGKDLPPGGTPPTPRFAALRSTVTLTPDAAAVAAAPPAAPPARPPAATAPIAQPPAPQANPAPVSANASSGISNLLNKVASGLSSILGRLQVDASPPSKSPNSIKSKSVPSPPRKLGATQAVPLPVYPGAKFFTDNHISQAHYDTVYNRMAWIAHIANNITAHGGGLPTWNNMTQLSPATVEKISIPANAIPANVPGVHALKTSAGESNTFSWKTGFSGVFLLVLLHVL